MARLPRLRLAGYPLHVVVRGNNRQPIFLTEGDRLVFHRTLVDAARRFGALVHAYVFMPNHIHLLATGSAGDSVSKSMQSLGRRYVRYFNFLHRRSGTLWEGRFYSSIVEAERYFFACQRYIEMNPVRAGLCVHPSEFAWSSFRHYAQHWADDLITRHALHRTFGCDDAATYCRMFDLPGPEPIEAIRDALQHGWALGSRQFQKEVAGLSSRRAARITEVGRPKKAELTEMESDPIYSSTSLLFSR